MKYILIAFTLALLFVGACDRFDNTFEPRKEKSFDEFTANFETIVSAGVPTEILSFYSDDYRNDEITKEDVSHFYNNHINSGHSFQANFLDMSNLREIEWNLLVFDSENNVVIDSLITDFLVYRNNRFQFHGNQADMRNVLVELFTATWCPNCPYAEDALYNLTWKYGNRLVFIEYHILDNLVIDNNSGLLNYYGGGSTLPTTVVNGNADIIPNAGPWIQDRILETIQPLLAQEPKVRMTLSATEQIENTFSAQVALDIDSDVCKVHLKLKYAVIEDLDENNTNVNGDYLHNVVKYKGEMQLSEYVNETPLEIVINDIESYPQGSSLVIWVQTVEPTYNPATCQVYNVIKQRIE